MSRIRRSFALLRASREVMSINPQLAAYPFVTVAWVVGFYLVIGLPLTFAAVYLLAGPAMFTMEGPSLESNLWPVYALNILFMLVAYFIAIYVNSAFYVAADAALQGEKVRMHQAFAKVSHLKKRILQWVAVSTVVSVVLEFIRSREGIFGQVLAIIGEIAWGLATIFAIPVLVRRGVGPVDVIRQSATLFKQTWGENVVAGFSFMLFGLLVILAPVALGGAVVAAYLAGQLALGLTITLVAIAALLLVYGIAYMSALQTVFYAALYRYADTGDYVGPFSQEMIAQAFVPKK
jgi:hypothetical protein